MTKKKKQKRQKRKRKRVIQRRTLSKDEIEVKYKSILLEIILEIDKYTTGRKNKCENEEYLNGIFRVFFDGVNWKALNKFSHKIDEASIRKKYYKWSKLHIFDIGYQQLCNIYNKGKSFKNLFIDSTIIENSKCSSKLFDFYFKVKSKKMLKINMITDKNQVPLAWEISKPGDHDCTFIKPLIKKLKVNLRPKCNLIGDKGYIVKHVINYKNKKKITTIFPYKKNQKKSITKARIKILSKRFSIEGANSTLKHTYVRLEKVRERNINNFSTFFLMAVTCQMVRNVYKYRLA